MEAIVVSGVALNMDEAKITLFGIPDKPGTAAKIFKDIADGQVNVDMIIQNKTETGKTDISFTVYKSDLTRALKTLEKIADEVGADRVTCDKDVAKLSVVGIGMRSHTGIASKMFSALAKKKINIDMISTSEIKVSCVIDGAKGKEALRVVHEAFGLGRK